MERIILTYPKRLEQKNNVMKVMRNNVMKAISMSPVFPSKRDWARYSDPGTESPNRVNWSERIRHFEVARETGSTWLSKCIVGLFWGTHFQHGGNFAPKTVPQYTLTTILTRSPAQPQSSEYMRKYVDPLTESTALSAQRSTVTRRKTALQIAFVHRFYFFLRIFN